MPHTDPSPRTLSIDHPGPGGLSDLVRQCLTDHTPIVDYGIAHTGLGHPPPHAHIRLTQCSGGIEHDDGDMVVRVDAGVTLGTLQAALRTANQFLPVDANEDLTLGEIILHNVYGPLRVGYGGIRDLLLGLSYIDGRGRDIRVGGRTVKNVAGYDVTRLMVGSLGELGLVYEATLRTSAIPETVLTAEINISDPAYLDSHTTDLLVSDAAPVAMSLLTRGVTHRVWLSYFGHPDGCRAQQEALERFIGHTEDVQIVNWHFGTLPEYAERCAHHHRWRRRAAACVKMIAPPATTGATCKHLTREWPMDHTPLTINVLPVHGCLFVGGDLTASESIALDRMVNRLAAPAGGLRVWYNRPVGAESIAPFAPPQPDWPMLTRLKRSMDPHNLFNPGRLIPAEGTPS